MTSSKYESLAIALAARDQDRWRVSFQELEAIIGAKLPASAFKYPAWWSNNPTNNAMTRIWLKAGWRTEQVDVPAQRVVFRRAGMAETAQAGVFGERSRDYGDASARPPETKMAGGAAEALAIGRNIRAARERAGLSEAVLGASLGLDANAVRRLEAGFGLEAMVRLKRLMTTLNLRADDLLGASDGMGDEAPMKPRIAEIYGCMKGTMKIAPGVDLTAPLTGEWQANEAKWSRRGADPGRSASSPPEGEKGRPRK